jgi:hypothetical protein
MSKAPFVGFAQRHGQIACSIEHIRSLAQGLLVVPIIGHSNYADIRAAPIDIAAQHCRRLLLPMEIF